MRLVLERFPWLRASAIGILCGALWVAIQPAPASVAANPPSSGSDYSSNYETVCRNVRESVVEIRALALKTIVRKVITTTTKKLLGHPQPIGRTVEKTVTTKVRTSNVGSGVILNTAGCIVTNAHVVYDATSIQVVLADRRTYQAKIVGTDPVADLAVIQIHAPYLKPARLGHSSQLQPGQRVLDVGSPFRLTQSMTHGIISALHRRNNRVTSADDPQIKLMSHENFIQTDAPTDPGSSGGALVNMRGQVIGINESIKSGGGGGFNGIGFVIPAAEVRFVTAQLIHTGHVKHGRLGCRIQEVTIQNPKPGVTTLLTGLRVVQVTKNSPAWNAGLRTGDVIVALNGRKIHRVAQLRNRIEFSAPGTHMSIELWRGSALKQFAVVTGG